MMRATRHKAARPIPAVAWQATDPLPRGWRPWLVRLLAGYVAALGYPGRGVTLLVTGDAAVRRLNARYRRRDRTTDILSFSYLPSVATGKPRLPAGALLGELVVSYPRIKAQARINGWPPRTELARLLAHGCVHLVGYDHPTRARDREMRGIEEELLEKAGFPGLYPAPKQPRPRKR